METILLKKSDYLRIAALLEWVDRDISVPLLAELNRADVVEDELLPGNVVCMNSIVEFLDIRANTIVKIKIVFPQDADPSKNWISVLAPVGAALIGLSVGQDIKWPVPKNRVKSIKVLSVDQKA